jgi:hypothetical protein
MDRDLKIVNIALAVIFGAIGIVAFVAAVFWGKTQHFLSVAICAMAVGASVVDLVRERREAKTYYRPDLRILYGVSAARRSTARHKVSSFRLEGLLPRTLRKLG